MTRLPHLPNDTQKCNPNNARLKSMGTFQIDAFKLWTIWKARGDAGLCRLADHVMEIAQFCLEKVAQRSGFRLVAHTLQCPNVCFWYIPKFMRAKTEDAEWWELIHKVSLTRINKQYTNLHLQHLYCLGTDFHERPVRISALKDFIYSIMRLLRLST